MEHVFVGVDGGGSHTTAVVLNSHKELIGTGHSGSTNWNSVGLDQAKLNLLEAINNALEAAGKTSDAVKSVRLGMSGVDRADDETLVENMIKEAFPHVLVKAHNDAVAALSSGTLGKLEGIVVISGTGMISWGRNTEGTEMRCGGWGPLAGDGGSGYWIGAEVIKAAAKCADESIPPTSLLPALLTHLDCKEPQDLITWMYQDTAWSRFASLAPLATKCAQEGDATAVDIIQRAGKELAQAVYTVAKKLGYVAKEATFDVVCVGGVLETDGPQTVYSSMEVALNKLYPKAKLIHSSVSPAVGAALLSFES